jgi:molybdate transport system substrate-binding protein
LPILICAVLLGLATFGGVGLAAPGGDDGLRGEVTVFAAASLTDAFAEIGEKFEAAHPGTQVSFTFGSSNTLADQIISGAPADVFASANLEQMQRVVDARRVAGKPKVFVKNTLQIVVPKGNPANVTGLADFGKEELRIALCAEQVPCGALSKEVFAMAGVTPAPDFLESDVRDVLSRVANNEADAGLVYRTDVLSTGDAVEGIDFPGADQAFNEYPIAVLKKAANPAVARAFVRYVLSPEGQQVLAKFGFITTAKVHPPT